MSFVYPLGLIGLIGIPILIIIYIIKNKYTEQTIASTYIWHLSERFLKRKKPISKLQGLISLILQCLTILFISLLIAKPSLNVKNGAADYCFILDGSASMNKKKGDSTRFESAVNEIENIINSSKSGSTYTLIYSSSDTSTVYESLSNKDKAISFLDDLKCSTVSQTIDEALKISQDYFNSNSSLKTYLVTDKTYEVNNIELINVADQNNDIQVINSTYSISATKYDDKNNVLEEASLNVKGSVISYNSDTECELEFLIDGESVEKKTVTLTKNTEFEYSFSYEIDNFNYYEIKANVSDDLDMDNSYIVYNLVNEHKYKALIVSVSPFYFEAILNAYGKIDDVDSITLKEYETGNYTGYGLYLFDTNCEPSVLPTDGTIWLFNPQKSIDYCGFSYNNRIKSNSGYVLNKETVYGENKEFVSHFIDTTTYSLKVQNYNVYTINKNFTTLFTIDNHPVVFVGNTLNSKNREIVFGFDLRESNLAMSYNSLIMFRKLLDYSYPEAVTSSYSISGNEFNYNVISGTKSIRLKSPSNIETYLDTTNVSGTIIFDEIGLYTISYTMENGEKKDFVVYSSFPKEENIVEENLVASLDGTQEFNTIGSFSLLTICFILVILLCLADWEVYCYEQHQLF